MPKITAVSKGSDRGAILTPHRYKGGYYLVTRGRDSLDHNTKVFDESALVNWIQRGYGMRMSGPGHAPSTFMPQSLSIQK
jgi:hypothetical protein